MHVVYSASRNLYPYLPVAYMSLLEHNPGCTVWLFIEDDTLPYETPEQVKCVNVSGQTLFAKNGPNSNSPFTYLAMIRAAYPMIFTGAKNDCGVDVCPKLDRIISLDCDTIVLDSLQPLWDIDLTGKWFAAVPQYPDISRPFGLDHVYRNAGVMVFNLKEMYLTSVSEWAVSLLNARKYRFIDEEVLNLLNMADGDKRCVDLPSRYNEHTEVPQSMNPAIIHYAGEKMVWEQDPEMVYRSEYLIPWMQYAKKVN